MAPTPSISRFVWRRDWPYAVGALVYLALLGAIVPWAPRIAWPDGIVLAALIMIVPSSLVALLIDRPPVFLRMFGAMILGTMALPVVTRLSEHGLSTTGIVILATLLALATLGIVRLALLRRSPLVVITAWVQSYRRRHE